MPDETTDPRAFRSEAFVWALSAVKREQAAFREMLRTYRAPVGDADGRSDATP